VSSIDFDRLDDVSDPGYHERVSFSASLKVGGGGTQRIYLQEAGAVWAKYAGTRGSICTLLNAGSQDRGDGRSS